MTNVETKLAQIEKRKDKPAEYHTIPDRLRATSGSEKPHRRDTTPDTRETDQRKENLHDEQNTIGSMSEKRPASVKTGHGEQPHAQSNRPTRQVTEPPPKSSQQTSSTKHGNKDDEQQTASSRAYDKQFPTLRRNENDKTKTYSMTAGHKPTRDRADPQNRTQNIGCFFSLDRTLNCKK